MTVISFARKQFSQSMLTGVPQIIAVRGLFRKILKSIVLLVCVIGCTYQIWSFMTVFWTYPTNVDVIVNNPNIINLPAVTFCEYNGLKPGKFCEKVPDGCTPQKNYTTFCTNNFQFCAEEKITEPPDGVKRPAVPPKSLKSELESALKTNDSLKIRNFCRYALGIQDYEIVEEVSYETSKLTSKLLSVFNPEGLPTNCFAYNVLWGEPDTVQEQARSRNQYKILVRKTGEDNFYSSTPSAIQLVVHSPFMKLNPFMDGFSVKACGTYRMYLKVTQNFLLEAPYPTNCTDYQKIWKGRGGHGPLTKKMCVDECVFNKSMEIFGCIDPRHITHPDDYAPFCFNKELDLESLDQCDKACQPACYEESISVDIEEFENSLTSNQENKNRCYTGITISFIRTQVQKFIYSKKYEGVEAFGYIGGFLGMWLGLSLIAVCDFLETCLVIIIYGVKRLRKGRRKTRIQSMKSKKMFAI